MSEKRIDTPLALKVLIEYVNREIESLRTMVGNASIEQLRMMGLSVEAGWRLDYDNRQFVLIPPPPAPEEPLLNDEL